MRKKIVLTTALCAKSDDSRKVKPSQGASPMRISMLLVSAFALLIPISADAENMINLPGDVAGGVKICSVEGCIQTRSDRETPAQIIGYSKQIGTTVKIRGLAYNVPENQVDIIFKGCRISLESYLVKSFPPHSECAK